MLIKDYFRTGTTPGEVGIEVEMEGNRLPMELNRWWIATHDASLRGHSVEWVLGGPIPRKNVPQALKYLIDSCKASRARLNPSDRCGVHIHINCQEMNIQELFNFAILYLILEPALVHWCGENREGNMFCLRTSDAEFIIHALRTSLEQGTLENLMDDRIRYSSLNLVSLRKFGSLEFRSMETPKDLMRIKSWAKFLLEVKDFSSNFPTLPAMVENFSGRGVNGFVKDVFGEEGHKELEYPFMIDDIHSSIRRIQDIVYAERKFTDDMWLGKEPKKKDLQVEEESLSRPMTRQYQDNPDPVAPMPARRQEYLRVMRNLSRNEGE